MARTNTLKKPAAKHRRTAARVRAPLTGPRFTLTKLPVGYTTHDATSGLTWSHTLGRATWNDAQKLVDKLNAEKHGGHAGWRLPTVEELFLIADRSKSSPAIDKNAFPDTENDWYWTSTPYAPYSGYSWFVSFGYGYADGGLRVYDGRVRAVRASQ